MLETTQSNLPENAISRFTAELNRIVRKPLRTSDADIATLARLPEGLRLLDYATHAMLDRAEVFPVFDENGARVLLPRRRPTAPLGLAPVGEWQNGALSAASQEWLMAALL